jgi:hypothetical protein
VHERETATDLLMPQAVYLVSPKLSLRSGPNNPNLKYGFQGHRSCSQVQNRSIKGCPFSRRSKVTIPSFFCTTLQRYNVRDDCIHVGNIHALMYSYPLFDLLHNRNYCHCWWFRRAIKLTATATNTSKNNGTTYLLNSFCRHDVTSICGFAGNRDARPAVATVDMT